MGYKESLYDKISFGLAPVMRILGDVNVRLMGTRTNVLRIVSTSDNMLGDKSESLESSVINNVVIQYPFNNIELFVSKNDLTGEFEAKVESIDLAEILPVEMQVPFEGDHDEDVTAPVKGDLIVDVFYDEHNNPIPIIFEIARARGSFMGKFIIAKKYELTLKRGRLEADIQNKVNKYIDSLPSLA